MNIYEDICCIVMLGSGFALAAIKMIKLFLVDHDLERGWIISIDDLCIPEITFTIGFFGLFVLGLIQGKIL